jgi:hypothetical protein
MRRYTRRSVEPAPGLAAMDQRAGVFRVAADVADHDGIAAIERAALSEIAAALLVDADALREAAAQPKRSRMAV